MADPGLGGACTGADDVTLKLTPETWTEWNMGEMGAVSATRGWRIRWRLSPGKLTPETLRDAAVSATARAGCGRGRDGRGCGESVEAS